MNNYCKGGSECNLIFLYQVLFIICILCRLHKTRILIAAPNILISNINKNYFNLHLNQRYVDQMLGMIMISQCINILYDNFFIDYREKISNISIHTSLKIK